MKKHLQDSLVIGSPLFSMFFGAGNASSPYLGLESGPEWLAGFFQLLYGRHRLALLAGVSAISPAGKSRRDHCPHRQDSPQRSCAPLCCASVPNSHSSDRHHPRNLSAPAGVRLQSGALSPSSSSADPAVVQWKQRWWTSWERSRPRPADWPADPDRGGCGESHRAGG